MRERGRVVSAWEKVKGEIMNGKWELNEMRGKNPVHTGQFLTSYDQREFTQEEVVAREGAQNAMDAGRSSKGITQIEFHELKIAGKEKAELISIFGFDELLSPRLRAFEKNPRNTLFSNNVRQFLKQDDMSALLIRDRNTCGLGGAWEKYERDDHFSRLVCALNLGDKADGDSNSGGSFGLGKTAYAKSSKINTVLYHSTFEKSDRTDGVSRRLMVAGVYPQHQIDSVDYGGFAYFGKPDPKDTNSVKPFENEEAKKLWADITNLFGIDATRDDTDYGTDILIFMSDADLEAIKRATEDYYFPAIIDQSVNITFFDSDGNNSHPKPLDRKDLDQFVRLMKAAKGKEEKTTDRLDVSKLRAFKEHKMGRIALEAAEVDEANSTKNNCVAIMRGTGMIINYLKVGSERYEPAVGAFYADEDIWKYLVASENAAHSEWNHVSRRLQQDFPEIGKEIVESLNNRLRSRFSNFQKNLQPDVSTTRSESGLLARLLSGALAGGPGDVRPPQGMPNPVSLSLKQSKRENSISRWRLLIQSNEHTPESPFALKVLPSISLAGEKMIPIKHKEFSITNEAGKVLDQGTKPELEFQFQKGDLLDLYVSFNDPGRQNFVVKCNFIADLESAND